MQRKHSCRYRNLTLKPISFHRSRRAAIFHMPVLRGFLFLLFSATTLVAFARKLSLGDRPRVRFRPEVEADAPLCVGPNIFTAYERTMHHGKWTFSSNNVQNATTIRAFHGSDATHPQCVLTPISAEEARQCLTDRHIVFIGDSITRYQGQSLMAFLHTGVWPPPHLKMPVSRFSPELECGTPGIPLRCDHWRHDDRIIDNLYYSEAGVNITVLGYYDVARGHAPIGFVKDRLYTLFNQSQV